MLVMRMDGTETVRVIVVMEDGNECGEKSDFPLVSEGMFAPVVAVKHECMEQTVIYSVLSVTRV
jgi:hypothetical protein